ncbi:hypothetical protein ACFU51_03780 [Streptomyces sp. NPDC057430]|uniref:hypothetical protein n=1 Tax=Streptomyces sp. NPDC057430 TaxID=3346131 RepID=UPI00368ED933
MPRARPRPDRRALRAHQRPPRRRRPAPSPARRRPPRRHLAQPGTQRPLPWKDTSLNSAEITLFTSKHDGIVALVTGDNWRWARKILLVAGFAKEGDGNYALPLADLPQIRAALTDVHELARACQIKVTATHQPYVGDFARDMAEHLPGQWSVKVENYSLPVWQEDLAACLWDTSPRPDAKFYGPLLHTVEKYRVPWAAVLRSDTGTELSVVQAPRDGLYHVGALAPRDMYLDEEVVPPRSITVQPSAVTAARRVASVLLADYRRAVLQSHLNHLADDLAWAQEAFEHGTVQSPPQPDLAAAFARFTTHAPHLIAALRQAAPGTVGRQEAAFLDRMDSAFGTQPPSSDPDSLAAVPSVDPLALWLMEGGELVSLARTAHPALTPAPAAAVSGRSPAVAGALPTVLPPRSGAVPSRR